MWRRRTVTVGVGVPVMSVAVGTGMSHRKMLYYNITGVYRSHHTPYGRPIAIAMAAARNGNGSDTAARNQTNRAGMNGISHNKSR
jgi:hypothetical protein